MHIDAMNELTPERILRGDKQHNNKFKTLEKSQVLSGIYNKDSNSKKFSKQNIKKNTRVFPKSINQNVNEKIVASNFGNQKLIYNILNDQSIRDTSYSCKSSLSNQNEVFVLSGNPNKYNMIGNDIKNDHLLLNYNFGASSLPTDAHTQDPFSNSFR